MTPPTEIPAVLKPLLDAYISQMDAKLSGFMTAFYLHGSIALGAFNPQFSDIDFIAVLSRQTTPHDLETLRAIHHNLQQKYPDWPLSGSYLQAHDLGLSKETIEPAPYFDDGNLHESGHHDINAVTWWTLKHHGLTLTGIGAKNLEFNVDWQNLITEMQENLNTYWAQFSRIGRRSVWLLTDDGIQWTVLGVLRQFYTFREDDITSKTGAGDYALQNLPQRWHRMIQEALNIRNQTGQRCYRFRLFRAIEAFKFMRYIITQCNTIFN